MDGEMILDCSDYSTAHERILNKWKREKKRKSNENPNDYVDMWKTTSKMLRKWRSTKKTTMSLWHLNDGCLHNILKCAFKTDEFQAFKIEHWSLTCTQFKEFYDKMFLKDKLHKISTTKIVTLNDDKEMLDEIIQHNLNIVEVRGNNLTNSDLSAIDLLSGIKRLTLRNSQLTGKHINELTDLEELELQDIEGFLPKNLSLIFKNNELRVLKLLRVPGAFTEHLAYEISQNLMIHIHGRSSYCEFQKCVHFFNELSNNMNLQELQIINGIVTQDDLEILASLRNLKKLTINETVKVHLRDFRRFSHLEELHLLLTVVNMAEFMEILCDCPQLTVFAFQSIFDLTEEHFFAAINLVNIQNRDKLPVRVLAMYYWRLFDLVRKHTDYLAIEGPPDL